MARSAGRLVFAACLLCTADVSAQQTVLVMHGEGAPQRPGLVGALRVQLAGIGSARSGGEIPPGGLSARVRAASARARDERAVLSVWVEPDAPTNGEQQLVLYQVGSHDGAALLEVMRLPDGSDADADRSLALKVREVFERVQQQQSADGALAASLAAPPGPSAAGSSAEYGVVVSVGALWAPSLLAHEPSGAGLETAFGVLALWDAMAFALSLRMVLPAATTQQRLGHRVEVSERSFLVAFAAHHRSGRLQLGGRLAAGVRLQDVAGTTADSTRATVDSDAAVLRAGPIARFDLLDRMAIEAWIGVELNGAPRSFEVNGVEVARSGLLRPFAVISLAVDAI